jgi:hypothetical protein
MSNTRICLFAGKVKKMIAPPRELHWVFFDRLDHCSLEGISFEKIVTAWISQFSMQNETNQSTGWMSIKEMVVSRSRMCSGLITTNTFRQYCHQLKTFQQTLSVVSIDQC